MLPTKPWPLAALPKKTVSSNVLVFEGIGCVAGATVTAHSFWGPERGGRKTSAPRRPSASDGRR
eukprot:6075350-Pyramimonas_sp.AAC.2